jgi:hypothetical protein
MIVVATPRSGGTAFCTELSIKYDLPFLGEMSSAYLKGIGDKNKKEIVHPGTQSLYDDQKFIRILQGIEKGVVLVNKTPYRSVYGADYILLRDPAEVLLSMANTLYKVYPKVSFHAVCSHLSIVFEDMYGLITCCSYFDTEIIIYEQYFGTKGTGTESIKDLKLIKRFVQTILNRSDIYSKFEKILSTNTQKGFIVDTQK